MSTTPNHPNRLEEQRKKSRLTIYEVAKLLDLSASAVSRHESSARALSPEIVDKYAKLYKCQTHELFLVLDGDKIEETTDTSDTQLAQERDYDGDM